MWQRFYIKAIDYLEALDIYPDQEDDTRRGWKQIKMMFKGEDRKTLQTLLENNTITQEDQCIPSKALQAIQTTIKEGEHFWHYRDEIFSDIRQQAHEGIHTLNTRITSLVNNYKFTDTPTKETVKIMLLAHAVKFQSKGLDQATRPIYTYLHLTFQPLQTPRTVMQTVLESTTQRQNRTDYTCNSHSNTIFNTPRCHHSKPNIPLMQTQPPQGQMPSLQPMMLQL